MDSDKRSSNDPLKERVERAAREVTVVNGFAWVTSGREIENYFPIETLRQLLGNPDLPEADRFADIFEHIGKPIWSKVEMAHKVVPLLSRAALEGDAQFAETLTTICARMRNWNGMV